jgi:hypothetical protein
MIRRSLFLLVAGLTGMVSVAAADMHDNTYDWSAELIAFDDAAHTMTVRARIEDYASIPNLDEFSEGDRLTLVWTGRSWAAGVRDLGTNPETAPEALTLPVEFVGTENDGRYVSFRVPVPADSLARVRELMIGDRVTGVSPRGDAEWSSGVVSVRHYNDVNR